MKKIHDYIYCEKILVIASLIIGLATTFLLIPFTKFDLSVLNLGEVSFLLITMVANLLFLGEFTLSYIFERPDENEYCCIFFFFMSIIFGIALSLMLSLIIDPIFIISGVILFVYFVSCLIIISKHSEEAELIA